MIAQIIARGGRILGFWVAYCAMMATLVMAEQTDGIAAKNTKEGQNVLSIITCATTFRTIVERVITAANKTAMNMGESGSAQQVQMIR